MILCKALIEFIKGAGNNDMRKSLKGLISGTFRLLTLELLGPEKQLFSFFKTHPAGDVLWVFVEPGNVVP